MVWNLVPARLLKCCCVIPFFPWTLIQDVSARLWRQQPAKATRVCAFCVTASAINYWDDLHPGATGRTGKAPWAVEDKSTQEQLQREGERSVWGMTVLWDVSVWSWQDRKTAGSRISTEAIESQREASRSSVTSKPAFLLHLWLLSQSKCDQVWSNVHVIIW